MYSIPPSRRMGPPDRRKICTPNQPLKAICTEKTLSSLDALYGPRHRLPLCSQYSHFFQLAEEQILGKGGHLEIEMTTSSRKGHHQPNARDAGEKVHRKPRSLREQLLIWLQGEELFRRSSPLEQSITYSIFSILSCQQLIISVSHLCVGISWTSW